MHRPELLRSFFLGGFECSTHRRHDGRRLDLLEATQHDRHAENDYARLQRHGLSTARDGLRWHLIESRPGQYDFSSFLPQLESAERTGTQVIWDLCHYGWPDTIDIWRPEFVERFARFARAVAQVVKDTTSGVPFYCIVNEISYWAWAGGDQAHMNPMARGRGLELKHQLVRAAIAATRAVREIDSRARFVHVDPLINVTAGAPEFEAEAAGYQRAQFDSWLLLSGELWPGLGGDPSLLDIVGVNHYAHNQWLVGGENHGRRLLPDDPRYRPLRQLLADAAERLERPLLIAETGAEADERVPWFEYVAGEAMAALRNGVPLEGVCLYPILDYPGWSNERHCATGLYGPADSQSERPLHVDFADAIAIARQDLLMHVQPSSRPKAEVSPPPYSLAPSQPPPQPHLHPQRRSPRPSGAEAQALPSP